MSHHLCQQITMIEMFCTYQLDSMPLIQIRTVLQMNLCSLNGTTNQHMNYGRANPRQQRATEEMSGQSCDQQQQISLTAEWNKVILFTLKQECYTWKKKFNGNLIIFMTFFS